MATVNWTPEQKCAIEHKNGAMLVSAAAGSGKTAVLVERVIRLMETTDIDKMLVVTFTNAAAANMKQGIHKAITEKLEVSENEQQRAHYAKQLSLLANANITTIHAFCSKFVREHFDALNLSPTVKLGDVTQLELMLLDAIDDAIEQSFDAGDPEFSTFARQTVSKTNDALLSETVLAMYRFLMAQPNPKAFLENTVSLYETQNAEAILSTPPLADKIHMLCKKLLQTAKHNCDVFSAEAYTPYAYALPHFETHLQLAIQIEATNGNLAEIERITDETKLSSARFARKDVPPETVEQFKAMHGNFKATLEALTQMAQTYNTTAFKEFLALQAPQIRAFSQLVCRAIDLYTARKREQDLLDFNDLEHLTISLLYENGAPTPLAQAAAKNFEFIIVDEYQDTNLVQETILQALSNGGQNLFMVGDIKQSIYGFRNTAPDLFMEKSEKYSRGEGGQCVHLNANFRSRPSVLNFANFLFYQLMSKECGGSPYTEAEALNPHGNFPGTDSPAEFYILSDPLYQEQTTEGEARFCAQKITEMLNSGYTVTNKDGSTRKATYRDFAILSRSMRDVAQIFYDTLTACGIPVYCDTLGTAFLESMEIQSIVAFLRAFDNPLQDIFLLSAFTSPIFGTPDYDLVVRIRQCAPGKSLYACMCAYPKTAQGYARVQAFLQFLHKYRFKANQQKVADLLHDFLTETDFNAYILSLHGGAERLSNVRYLESLAASSFPGSETGGLYAFLEYLEKHNTYKSDFSNPKILPEDANMVQLTTIHKSKGLEYPIVFLVGTGKEFVRNNQERIFCHAHIGFGFPYRNVEKNLKLNSPVVSLIKTVKEMEEKSEELRILYVALTRAKEKMIVIGSVKPNKTRPFSYAADAQNADKGRMALDPSTVFAGKSDLEWLLYATERFTDTENYPLIRKIIHKIPDYDATVRQDADLTPLPPNETVRNAFAYQYPYQAHTEIYSKISVTELKRLLEQTDDDTFYPYKPLPTKVSFETENTACNRGTITHFILEKTSFKVESCEETVSRLLAENALTQEEAALADRAAINRFLQSPLCNLLRKADFIEKELSFNIFVDSALLNPKKGGAMVQLQGTIDCLAEVDNTLYVLDFKTDTVTDQNRAQKLNSYRKQINFYKMGAVKLYPKRPVKGYLIFLQEENGIYEI